MGLCVQWASSQASSTSSARWASSSASPSFNSSSTLAQTRTSPLSLPLPSHPLTPPPHSTTYCYPAEVFPTKFRASAHGMSAACGKAGAIISALVFNSLTNSIGTPNVLWIFFGCCIAGAGFSLLLPEVRGRDPDLVYAEELREEERLRAGR